MSNHYKSSESLQNYWESDPRWKGIRRPYQADRVLKLRGSLPVTHTLAEHGSRKLYDLFSRDPFVRCLSAVTGNQAIQQVEAGLNAIYISGWQVAGDANTGCQVYPDQSLYPVNSVPRLVERVNRALRRADQIAHVEGRNDQEYFAPIVADAEAGFGGNLNAFELMSSMIESGAAAVHFEDQLSSAKKCGHMGGKVLVPTSEFVQKLISARLAADVMGVPSLIIARTDADSAKLLTSDIDPMDQPFIDKGRRTSEGFFPINGGLDFAIERALAYAPYADLLWCETSTPDLDDAERFAEAVHEKFPDKWLAYNCSPSFNWKEHLDDDTIAHFQERLGEMGYVLQFVTLSGWHSLNSSIFELSNEYRDRGMAAYAELQEKEFEMGRQQGYRAIRHQAFVGAGYFDEVQMTITGGESETVAMRGSTEEGQF